MVYHICATCTNAPSRIHRLFPDISPRLNSVSVLFLLTMDSEILLGPWRPSSPTFSCGKWRNRFILISYIHILADPRQQAIDLEPQAEFPALPQNLFLSLYIHLLQPARYLRHITIQKFERALSLATIKALPRTIIEGRYQKISFEQKLCP